jgi:GT2 family glycosyltransferase
MLGRCCALTEVELIVVSDSPSHVREKLGEFLPQVVWIQAEEFGVARYRNLGARKATSDVIVFLDTDTVLSTTDVFGELTRVLRDHPRAAAVGPRLLNPDGTLQFSARRFYTPLSLALRRVPGKQAASSRSVQRHLMIDWDRADERTVDWVVGACLALRQEAFRDVGPFSEASAFGFEDVEWCYRARLKGWETWFTPSATVVHEYVRSSNGLNRRTLSHVRAAAAFSLAVFRQRASRLVGSAQ